MTDTLNQAENTAATKENSEDGHPFGRTLQSDYALNGPGKGKASLNAKVVTDTALPSPQKRHFRD